MANPLQYSCLENSMDRGAWQATVHRVIKNQTQLSIHTINEILGKCAFLAELKNKNFCPIIPGSRADFSPSDMPGLCQVSGNAEKLSY